jgi:hypothetical protein
VEERVTDRQVPDSLTVPEVFGEEPPGSAFDRGLDHEGIPKCVRMLFVKVDRPQGRPALHEDGLSNIGKILPITGKRLTIIWYGIIIINKNCAIDNKPPGIGMIHTFRT